MACTGVASAIPGAGQARSKIVASDGRLHPPSAFTKTVGVKHDGTSLVARNNAFARVALIRDSNTAEASRNPFSIPAVRQGNSFNPGPRLYFLLI
jgi:hypothetical protein